MGKQRKPFIDKEKSLTYQVVHRSQRDPRIADEEAPQHVLKPIPTSLNHLKKGKGLDPDAVDYEFEEVSDYDDDEDGYEDYESGEEHDGEDGGEEEEEEEEGSQQGDRVKKPAAVVAKEDPSMHGIFFKDQDSYDYLQHLRPIGTDPTAVFMDARNAPKKAPMAGIRFVEKDASTAMGERRVGGSTTTERMAGGIELPRGVLGELVEEETGLMNREAMTSVLDVDPTMREVIYALDDDAYVEEDLDDFFDALNAPVIPADLAATLVPDAPPSHHPAADDDDEEEAWVNEYRRFDRARPAPGSDDGFDERGDDLGSLPGGRRRERNDDDGMTNFSMTSSAMFRNQHLTLLDDRFDEVMKGYDDESGSEGEEDKLDEVAMDRMLEAGGEGVEAIIPGSVSQKRLDKIFDSFLDTTEVVGRKKLLLNRVFPLKQMDAVRAELKVAPASLATESVENLPGGEKLDEQLEEEFQRMHLDKGKERWDVETVLSTYSNIYNHPSMIREGGGPRFRMKRGVPVVVRDKEEQTREEESEEEEEEDDAEEKENRGKARPRQETPEEKKARKQAIKQERKERRVDKKALKTAFGAEAGRQRKTVMNAVQQDRIVPI
ncbi:hypothetical protein HK101_007128 [Irineochytrium annulatum]|nr:hypothetical protein HK101_007128 [Irineochytrium annulatum]